MQLTIEEYIKTYISIFTFSYKIKIFVNLYLQKLEKPTLEF